LKVPTIVHIVIMSPPQILLPSLAFSLVGFNLVSYASDGQHC